MQILPRGRGQSTGATFKIALCKSPPGEAGIVSQCMTRLAWHTRSGMLICITRSRKKHTSSLCGESRIRRRKPCLLTEHDDTSVEEEISKDRPQLTPGKLPLA